VSGDIIDELTWRGLIAQSTDLDALRSALAANWLRRYGQNIDPEGEITVASGATELLIDAAGIRSLVDRQRLRFVLLANPVPSASNTAIVGVRAWVRGACSPVMSGHYRQGAGVRLTLYDCRP